MGALWVLGKFAVHIYLNAAAQGHTTFRQLNVI